MLEDDFGEDDYDEVFTFPPSHSSKKSSPGQRFSAPDDLKKSLSEQKGILEELYKKGVRNLS